MKEYIQTAAVRSPHGLSGELRIHPFAEDHTHFYDLKEVVLEKNGLRRVFCVENVREARGELLLKLRGIDNPEDARLYSGFSLLVPRGSAARLQDGEVYTADLIGLRVVYENEECGVVESLVEGTQALLLEVECVDGKRRLVPYLKGVFVGDVDLASGTLQLLRKDLVQ